MTVNQKQANWVAGMDRVQDLIDYLVDLAEGREPTQKRKLSKRDLAILNSMRKTKNAA